METIDRWLYYHWLVILDIWRLRRAFLLHVVIVAGICLPILILGALKRGHVAQLREDLVKSVTGRQVIAWSAQNGRMLEARELDDFGKSLPHVELVVAEAFRPVQMRKAGSQDAGLEVTVYTTLPGDPMLVEHGVTSPASGEDAVLLSNVTAEQLGVGVGDKVDVVLRRKQSGKSEAGVVPFTVSGIFAASAGSGNIGYVHLTAIEDIERFVRGNAVKRWSLPAFAGMSAADRYAGYLVFCQIGDDLKPDDVKTLGDRALDVSPINEDDRALLARLLKDGFEERLKVHRVMARQAVGKPVRRLALSPSDVAGLTLAQDDIVLPWNEPRTLEISQRRYLGAGLSFPERRWLRGEFRAPALPFSTDFGKMPSEFSVKFPEGGGPLDDTNATLALGETLSVPLDVVKTVDAKDPSDDDSSAEDVNEETGSPRDTATPLAVVPAPLLAHVDALDRGEAMFDAESKSFPPVPVTPNYDKLRIYATSIDGVPSLVESLRDQGYGVTSEFTRIKEIHDQDASLALLVQIVTWGVLLFGILTVSIVLIDSTDRKSKTIGIMRIMGVSSPAVSYMVMLRAAIIGLCAAAVAAFFGWGFCRFLTWSPGLGSKGPEAHQWWEAVLAMKPVALARLDLWQDRAFLLATVACSVLGSLIPAVKASRLDPFDAIIQSRNG